MNVAMFFPTLDPLVSAQPVDGRPEEYECPIRVRIGRIGSDGRILAGGLTTGEDLWWAFGGMTDVAVVGAEIVRHIEERALAFFERMRERQALLEAVRTGELGTNPMWSAAIAAWAGDRTSAESTLERELQQESSRT